MMSVLRDIKSHLPSIGLAQADDPNTPRLDAENQHMQSLTDRTQRHKAGFISRSAGRYEGGIPLELICHHEINAVLFDIGGVVMALRAKKPRQVERT